MTADPWSRAGREFKLLETNQLGERISASPAITATAELSDRFSFVLPIERKSETAVWRSRCCLIGIIRR